MVIKIKVTCKNKKKCMYGYIEPEKSDNKFWEARLWMIVDIGIKSK